MELLQDAVVYLAAATLAVPLSRKLGFGAVLGYLLAGVIVGPWGLRLVGDVDSTLHFAELGVVFLLFVIGLELQPARLWVLRRSVFGLGTAQMAVTGGVLTLIAWRMGLSPGTAVIVGFGLALSSTAFVLQMLAERKDLTAPHGRAGFGVLLFQDLAVIPLIAIVPLLAGGEDAMRDAVSPAGIALKLGAFVALIIVARYSLRPLLRLVASAKSHEIFTAAALLLVISSALAMYKLGLSMGLGAFLAGVLVADSEYRHQLEADIEPFKGLLLGLFFVAVGMSANLSLLISDFWPVLAVTVGLIAIKTLSLAVVARAFSLPLRPALLLGLTLSQGGEFGFVLFAAAADQALLTPEVADLLILAVTLSMAATPVLYLIGSRMLGARAHEKPRPFDEIDDHAHDVVIAGFGRFGQIVARVLAMRGIPFTALESSSSQVDFVRRFGNKIFFGDASRLELLRTAHLEKAKVFVLAVEDLEMSIRIAHTVRDNYPSLPVYARARNRVHAHRLMDAGARVIIRDTFLSSIHMSEQVLTGLGLSVEDARAAAQMFKEHDEKALLREHAIHHDEEALIKSAREAAADLRALFEADQKSARKQ